MRFSYHDPVPGAPPPKGVSVKSLIEVELDAERAEVKVGDRQP